MSKVLKVLKSKQFRAVLLIAILMQFPLVAMDEIPENGESVSALENQLAEAQALLAESQATILFEQILSQIKTSELINQQEVLLLSLQINENQRISLQEKLDMSLNKFDLDMPLILELQQEKKALKDQTELEMQILALQEINKDAYKQIDTLQGKLQENELLASLELEETTKKLKTDFELQISALQEINNDAQEQIDALHVNLGKEKLLKNAPNAVSLELEENMQKLKAEHAQQISALQEINKDAQKQIDALQAKLTENDFLKSALESSQAVQYTLEIEETTQKLKAEFEQQILALQEINKDAEKQIDTLQAQLAADELLAEAHRLAINEKEKWLTEMKDLELNYLDLLTVTELRSQTMEQEILSLQTAKEWEEKRAEQLELSLAKTEFSLNSTTSALEKLQTELASRKSQELSAKNAINIQLDHLHQTLNFHMKKSETLEKNLAQMQVKYEDTLKLMQLRQVEFDKKHHELLAIQSEMAALRSPAQKVTETSSASFKATSAQPSYEVSSNTILEIWHGKR